MPIEERPKILISDGAAERSFSTRRGIDFRTTVKSLLLLFFRKEDLAFVATTPSPIKFNAGRY
jgi:hypothetical protein